MAETPEKKTFSLKPIEGAMIRVLVETHQAQLSNFLSLLGVERFAYPITQHTKFKIDEGVKTVEMWEEPEQPSQDEAAAPEIPGAPGSSVANAVKE